MEEITEYSIKDWDVKFIFSNCDFFLMVGQ